MHLKSIELSGFKSFAKKSTLTFSSPISGIVGPNGSGKSNTAEAFRFVLGEQSMKALRGKRGPDLIWAGNTTHPKSNRARVSITFDNSRHLFAVDFDEVVIERVVHRDGANEYFINGSSVRLKDILELLANANIGSSGHHIISQGKADRILGASHKERREMIEDALGLRVYHYKKEESMKKLRKMDENMKEAHLQLREIEPQLVYLQRQMKRIERSRTHKAELVSLYTRYITAQRIHISNTRRTLETNASNLLNDLQALETTIATEKKEESSDTRQEDMLKQCDVDVQQLRNYKSTLLQEKGRLEGHIEIIKLQKDENSDVNTQREVPLSEVEEVLGKIKEQLYAAHKKRDLTVLHEIIKKIEDFLISFSITKNSNTDSTGTNDTTIVALEAQLEKNKNVLAELFSKEKDIADRRASTLVAVQQQHVAQKAMQQEYFELKDAIRIKRRELQEVESRQQECELSQEHLVAVEHKAQDRGIVYTSAYAIQECSDAELAEILQNITRTEVRLEEIGEVDEAIIQEYNEKKERHSFITHEITDIALSKQKLSDILHSLDSELSNKFTHGLAEINSKFNTFFSMLFDGGEALLQTVVSQKKDNISSIDSEYENKIKGEKDGIEVHVHLPRKKVTTLEVLSGGERALTSIALIFAMSQVNPPPFIILDETDAALDEANSRRYAFMVQELSKSSQLILITHNRQTMEAAGELYGVTMGSDGISKLLSVKFDEAVQVAK